MASNNIARLGVVLGLDTASWSADIDKAIAENRKLGLEIKRASNAAAAETKALIHATEDYGKEISKVAQIEREIKAGRFTGAQQNVIDELRKAAAAYDEVARAKKTSVTGGLTPQQQQALAYQTTDLVTQIASGQNAMIALLQQGGQLKDQFGGFANTFKMLSTVITPMRLAIGGVTAALGVLGFAFYKGSQESARLRDDLILTGNYADMTQKKFFDLARTTSEKLSVSIGDAKNVFGQLVASGKFTSQSIESVGQAILRIAELSGKSAEEISSQLIPMFNGTASSAKQLNDRFHFLTLEQYKQIEVLEKQGKSQEAAKLTADALNKKYQDQTRELGILEKAWKGLKEAASSAWDAMLGVGRASPVEESLERTKKVLAGLYKDLETFPEKERPLIQGRIKNLEAVKARLEKEIQDKKEQAAESVKSTSDINLYEKAGGYAKELALKDEFDKKAIENKFRRQIDAAGQFEKIELEWEEKIALAKADMAKKNRDENFVFATQNEKILAQQVEQISAEAQEKIRLYKINSAASTYGELKELEYEEKRATEAKFNEIALGYKLQLEAQRQSLFMENDLIDLRYKMIGASETEVEIAKSRLELTKQIKTITEDWKLDEGEKAGIIQRMLDNQKMKEEVLKLTESLKIVEKSFDSVFDNMMSAIERFVRTGKMSFKDLAKSIIQDLILIQMRAQMSGIFKLIGNYFTGGSVPVGDSLPTDIPMSANGGPISANEAHIVGERGPELFIPRDAGTIIPKERLGSALGGTTNITNYNIDAIDVKSFEQRLFGSSKAIWAANQYAQKSLAVTPGRM